MILGLNIIVGPGESYELERCLKSIRGPLFDEIIVTITSDDREVTAVANKYATKVCLFPWIQDFSAARNFCLNNTTTDYVLWLDADDVIKPSNYKKLLNLKETLNQYDVVFIPYIYHHDENDEPVWILPRERIFKRIPKIRWQEPIHECLTLTKEMNIHSVDNIFIDHYRTKPCDVTRNLTILKQTYEKNPSPRISYYYARDLIEAGKEEGYLILEKFIDEKDGSSDDLAQSCQKLANWYFKKENYESAKAYAFKSISFSTDYAEPYVLLGKIHAQQDNIDSAIQYNKEALTKGLNAKMTQTIEDYGLIPCANLSILYFKKGDHQESFRFNRFALEHAPDNIGLIHDRALLLQKITTKFNVTWMIPYFSMISPSDRIRRHNVHIRLQQMGIESKIETDYYLRPILETIERLNTSNLVVFTQATEYDLVLMRELKKLGKRVIADVCEALFDDQQRLQFLNEIDIIVCCSTVLSEMFRNRDINHTTVIKDAIEDDRAINHDYDRKTNKALYIGMGGNSFICTDVLKDTIEKAGYELVLITEWDNATKPWHLNTWHEDMNACDVVLCPQRVDVQPAKSNVKVTTAMALGLPVIASPLRAYTDIIKNGENGFICDTKEEWYRALMELKDPEKRKKIGFKAKNSIGFYSSLAISNQWINLFYDLLEAKEVRKLCGQEIKVKIQAPVDIIVISYNNLKYLKQTIASILLNTSYPYNLIISDMGSDGDVWDYLRILKGISVVGAKKKRINYSEACNAGIRGARFKYSVILSSETIVSKDWLNNLVEKMDSVPRLAMCGVLSNNDRGWLHGIRGKPSYSMKLEQSGIELVPGMRFEQIEPYIEELYRFMVQSNKDNKGNFIRQRWIENYAAIYARSALEEIGLFDDQFYNCEDLDLCLRLDNAGYVIGQSLDSFVFRYGEILKSPYGSNYELIEKKWRVPYSDLALV